MFIWFLLIELVKNCTAVNYSWKTRSRWVTCFDNLLYSTSTILSTANGIIRHEFYVRRKVTAFIDAIWWILCRCECVIGCNAEVSHQHPHFDHISITRWNIRWFLSRTSLTTVRILITQLCKHVSQSSHDNNVYIIVLMH